jgi:hypothetical protein
MSAIKFAARPPEFTTTVQTVMAWGHVPGRGAKGWDFAGTPAWPVLSVVSPVVSLNSIQVISSGKIQ